MKERMDALVARVGGPRRATIIAAGAGAVLLVLGLSWWATRPAWVPAATGLPLESVTDLSKRLADARISYRLDSGGQALLVPSTELARARVALAQGGLPGSGRPGMELFDQPSWGMTDFTQRINYRRALEGELERTIRKMRGVEEAQVHLAIEETHSFRRAQSQAEASVVLRLRSAQRPEADVVQGIQHLVASSVGGLQSANVMVIDDAGRLLSAPNEPGSLAALTNRQLAMRREVETHLERKAEALVSQVVGVQNARIEVSAEINFDRVERTMESLDPDRQVVMSEQSSEIIPGQEGGAGSRTMATTYNTPRQLETWSGSVGDVRRLTVAVLVNDAELADGERRPRTEEELQKIQSLVESAVGFQPTRGDQVSVVGMSFAPLLPVGEAPVGWRFAPEGSQPVTWIVGLIAVLAAFVFGRRALRAAPKPEAAAEAIAAAGQLEAQQKAESLTGATVDAGHTLPPVAAAPTARDHAIELIEHQPDVAARLVRSWLKEAGA